MKSRIALRAVVLAIWAAFFLWLAVSGEVTRYLGPRTYWVIWFGSIALTLAVAAHLPRLGRDRAPVRPSDVGGAVLMLVPLIAVLAVPSPDLGALAASRKATGLATLTSSLPRPDAVPGQLSFAEIHYASGSAEYARVIGAVEGAEVELTGFVTHPKKPIGDFALTRFYISCCAADAIPYSVGIESNEVYPEDTWLDVAGTLHLTEDGFVLRPSSVQEIDEPKNPYLY